MPAIAMVVAPLRKRAEDMPDSTYESSLSTLARNVLQDKSPRLFDYEIGFQLLEKSDDGDKAVGVFGFQIGPETLYAPVIFNKGAVKGTELLWAKSLNQFIPLAEGWVNAYMRRRPTSTGSVISREKSREGVGYPDLIPLIRSPFKMAHLTEYPPPPKTARLRRGDALGALADMKAAAAAAGSALDAVDLHKVAARSPKFAAVLRHWLAESPTYKRAFTQFYPHSPLAQPVAAAPAAPPASPLLQPPAPVPMAPPVGHGLAHALAPTAGSTPASSPVLDDGVTTRTDNAANAMAKAADYGSVAVTTHAESVGRLVPLSVEQAKDVAANGYSVNDSRTESSMVVPVVHNLNLSNPRATGRYRVLQPGGTFADRLVVFLRDRKADRRVIVLDVSPSGGVKAYGRCEPKDVWVQESEHQDDTATQYYKGLTSDIANFPEPKKVTPNWQSKYLIVGPDGVGFGPFTVRRDLTQEEGPTTLAVDSAYCGSCSPTSHTSADNDPLWFEGKANPYWGYGTRYERTPESSRSNDLNSGDQVLVLTGKPGHTLLRDRGDLLVPSGARMLTLEEGGADENITSDDSKDTILLGRPEDMDALLSRKSAELAVDRRYGTYEIAKKARLAFPAAVKELVEGWDLRLDDALELLKKADRHKVTVRVLPTERVWQLAEAYAKTADGPPNSYNIGAAAQAPDFPDPQTEYTEQTLSGSVPANTPYDVNLPVDPSMLDNNRWRMPGGMYAPPENSTIMQATQAAQKGVKEVFDTGSFSTLMRRQGDDVLIDDNLPDLMKALGAIGTLLFNLYYSSEEFEDRCGKNDLLELEGVLRSAFKSVGESLLFLKQKSVRAFPGDYGVDFSASTPSS